MCAILVAAKNRGIFRCVISAKNGRQLVICRWYVHTRGERKFPLFEDRIWCDNNVIRGVKRHGGFKTVENCKLSNKVTVNIIRNSFLTAGFSLDRESLVVCTQPPNPNTSRIPPTDRPTIPMSKYKKVCFRGSYSSDGTKKVNCGTKPDSGGV